MKLIDSIKSVFDLSKWTDRALVSKSLGFEMLPDQYRGLIESNYSLGNMNPYGLEPGTAGNYFTSVPGSGSSFTYTGPISCIIAYRRCPPVTAIINKKAQAYVNGKTWILNIKDSKEATSADAKRLRSLLFKPNAMQSWKQFEAQGYIYQQLFGYNVVLAIKPAGFSNNIDASSLWNIPPYMLQIQESNNFFYNTGTKGVIDRVTFTYRGYETDLPLEDIYIFKDFSPSLYSPVIPESRIISIELPINNIIGAYESRNVLINNRGAQGVFSSDQTDAAGKVPLTPTEKTAIQRDFMQYGLRRGQWQYIITHAALKWQSVGYPTKDLMLFEEIEGSTMAVCDAYGYPYRLMAAEKSASYNDVSEFKKMLYQDSIIPESISYMEQWDDMLQLQAKGIKFDKDFSHIAALQADAVDMATARNLRNQALEREFRYDLITMNRWLELNGEDPKLGGDIYFSQLIKTTGDPYARNAGSAAPIQDGQPLTTTPQNNNSNANP